MQNLWLRETPKGQAQLILRSTPQVPSPKAHSKNVDRVVGIFRTIAAGVLADQIGQDIATEETRYVVNQSVSVLPSEKVNPGRQIEDVLAMSN
jgi:hypothetical protein